MYIEEIRRAVLATPRERLPEIQAALWKSHAAGAVGDDDAQALAELIAVRRVVPGPAAAARRYVGSRPISSASIARRRRVASAGMMPPNLSCQFTLSEQSVLSIVAGEIAERGSCDRSVGELAGKAGCCVTTARNAIRHAKRLGILAVEARRVRFDHCLPNRLTIVSPEWAAWLRTRARKTRAETPYKFAQPTNNSDSYPGRAMRSEQPKENSRGETARVVPDRERWRRW